MRPMVTISAIKGWGLHEDREGSWTLWLFPHKKQMLISEHGFPRNLDEMDRCVSDAAALAPKIRALGDISPVKYV